MNKANKKYLWKLIQLTGDSLINKLPDHPNHPNGRNPYAHVALKVKNNFGKMSILICYWKMNSMMKNTKILLNKELLIISNLSFIEKW